VDKEEQTVVDREARPAYYLLLPFAVPIDIVALPFYLGVAVYYFVSDDNC
jgi:hypothetical protein